MNLNKLAVVVLAAGKGTRMRSDLPKVLHRVAGRSMLSHVLKAAGALGQAEIVVVVGPNMEAVAQEAAPHRCVVQETQEGTGHAVMTALEALEAYNGPDSDVLVVFGDAPLLTSASLSAMRQARLAEPRPELVLLGFRAADPTGYGRILRDAEGRPTGIVEHKDASEDQRRIDLCNAGPMLVSGAALFADIRCIDNKNAQGEYYLTDLVAVARAAGRDLGLVEADEDEVMGINSRAELAAAEAVLQDHLRARAMAEGATLVDPDNVWLSIDTQLGRDVTIQPGVIIGPGVSIGDRVEIRGFCHLEGVTIEADAVVGPYARLRPGSVIGPGARVGNFVEVKNASLGPGAKANHLSYVGDASVGAGANVGAGTITCNYDGFGKHRTEIGEGAFIGSNTALVAPVTVAAGALIAAGSTITDDVEPDALAVARGRQTNIGRGAARFREDRLARKRAKTGT